MKEIIERNIFLDPPFFKNNFISKNKEQQISPKNQTQTKEIFSDKWTKFDKGEKKSLVFDFQKDWFLDLYGFDSEKKFKEFLSDKKIILDAGCGLGYKAKWFADLAPHAVVIGVDISDAALLAAKNYEGTPNLFFLKADIADTGIKANTIDFTVCDQVIMHTEFPEKTFEHLTTITKNGGEFACYVYRKKALPRELLDDYFRNATHQISNDQLWELSSQLTELGKRFSKLNVTIDSPEIPLLGIQEGSYDIQRFIYWNFLKCFWREEYGEEMSTAINYDWYAPSNATRFSEAEFKSLINQNNLKISHFHQEEACYSGRFIKENK